jgi:hypothetical protein
MKRDEFHLRLNNVIHAVEKLKEKDFLVKDSTISILVESIKRAKETMFEPEEQISFILPDESSAELFTRIKLILVGDLLI